MVILLIRAWILCSTGILTSFQDKAIGAAPACICFVQVQVHAQVCMPGTSTSCLGHQASQSPCLTSREVSHCNFALSACAFAPWVLNIWLHSLEPHRSGSAYHNLRSALTDTSTNTHRTICSPHIVINNMAESRPCTLTQLVLIILELFRVT